MSLLEDVFLQDEADEAQELERVIDGDEFDDGPVRRSDSDNDSVKGDDEAEEEKRRVDPQSGKQPKIVKNPRFVLNAARLTGPRGIQVIPEYFKDFKFKGKGHEKEDLDIILKKLEHWAYRLYPKYKFDDCLKKIETLGKKRPVMVHLQKIRSDQYQTEDTVVQQDSSGDEAPPSPSPTPSPTPTTTTAPPEADEFDKLLQQQIEIARMTPAPAPTSAKKPAFATVAGDVGTPFTMPKATSSPSISDDQRERMLRNRRLAEERRLAKLKQNTSVIEEESMVGTDTVRKHNKSNVIESDDEDDMHFRKSGDKPDADAVKKHNKSNVIDSDDEEDMRVEKSGDKPDADSVKKHNKSNVIDSDDEEDMHVQKSGDKRKSDTVKKHNKSNMIQSDDDDMPKLHTVKKNNKTNVIESDDEDDMRVNESGDMPELTNEDNVREIHEENIVLKNAVNNPVTLTVNNSNFDALINSTDTNENCKNANKTTKTHNRSNVIDSSDDECDMTSVNQSITVDVHEFRNASETIHNEDNIVEERNVNLEKEIGAVNVNDVGGEQNRDTDEIIMDVDFNDDF